MLKIGDLVVPVTREWDRRKYTVLDIYVSELNGERLVRVGYIGNMSTPSISLTDEKLFVLAQEREDL